MKNLVLLLLCLFAVASNSCTPLPAPAPTPTPPVVVVDAGPSPLPMGGASPVDAGPAPPEPLLDPGVRDACAALARVGCSEGGESCGRVLQKVVTERLTQVPLACLVAVKTKANVHACGNFVACK